MWNPDRVTDHDAFHAMVQEMARLRHSERRGRLAIEGVLRTLCRHSEFPVQAWHLMTNPEIAETMRVLRLALGDEP